MDGKCITQLYQTYKGIMGLSDTKITSRLKKCLFKSLCSVSCLNNEVDNGQEENGHFTINKENNNELNQ